MISTEQIERFKKMWTLPTGETYTVHVDNYQPYENMIFGRVSFLPMLSHWKSAFENYWSLDATKRSTAWHFKGKGFLVARPSNVFSNSLLVTAINEVESAVVSNKKTPDRMSIRDAVLTLSSMEFDPKSGAVVRQPSPEAYRNAVRLLASLSS